MTNQSSYAPTLRTQADIEAAWRHLINPLGWPEPRLWFMFVGADGVPFPQLCQVEKMPTEIGAVGAMGVARTTGELAAEMGFDRVNFLLCRPGGGAPNRTDLRNAADLYAACRVEAVPVGVIHLATDEDFWPIPLDAVGQRVT